MKPNSIASFVDFQPNLSTMGRSAPEETTVWTSTDKEPEVELEGA